MKYIPVDELKAEIERRKDIYIGHALCLKETNLIDGFDEALNIIESLQQERPETPSGEEVMNICNQILIDWVKKGKTPEEREQREQAHIRFFELYDEYMQEQPEVDLEKEIDAVWNPRFNLGWDENSMLTINHDGFVSIARHFYELRKKLK